MDVFISYPNGTQFRERKKSPVTSKSDSKRWGENREKELIFNGPPKEKKQAPTLKDFSKTFMEGHPKASRHKPSGIASKETIFRVHLIPFLGSKRLDEITNQDVQKLKGKLEGKAVKTVNNILSVLNSTLKRAVEWDVIDQMPCRVELLKVPEQDADANN